MTTNIALSIKMNIVYLIIGNPLPFFPDTEKEFFKHNKTLVEDL